MRPDLLNCSCSAHFFKNAFKRRCLVPGEAALLSTFRDLVAQNFGDHGLGQALASLSGMLTHPFVKVQCNTKVCIDSALLCSEALQPFHWRLRHSLQPRSSARGILTDSLSDFD